MRSGDRTGPKYTREAEVFTASLSDELAGELGLLSTAGESTLTSLSMAATTRDGEVRARNETEEMEEGRR